MNPSPDARTAITAPDAPAAIGPYSHAVAHGGTALLLRPAAARPATGTGRRLAGGGNDPVPGEPGGDLPRRRHRARATPCG